MMISLAILYFYLSRSDVRVLRAIPLQIISTILSLITIVFFFQPFKIRQLADSLPQNFAFLKNPGFTPLGSQLDLAIFLGFFAVFSTISVMVGLTNQDIKPRYLILNTLYLILSFLALFLTIYSLIRSNIILPPFRLSWYAAVEILKNPQTAFLGVGIGNFNSIFTRVKDLAYNQSSLWQISSFNVSSSAILHIFTESGTFGLLAFGLLIISVLRQLIIKPIEQSKKTSICLFVYLFICLLIFPSSLIVWFLFFVLLAQISQQYNNTATKQSFDFSDILPFSIGIIIISFGVIGASGYFLGRSYAAEYYFRKSLNEITKNNLKEVYNNQRQAVILNPYIERFRLNFSQTNLLIANSLASKKPEAITEQDRQTIAQAIQAGIAEAKAVISLNPQKAANWENLAVIYRNIINVVQGADVWTISSYQRAIVADPQNPLYRVDLGGVYYSSGKYDVAVNFFEQAVELKPDWPNAHYNYAWASYQKGSYSQAASAMQNVLNLLDPKINKVDYKKAQKDLEEFKKKLPEEKQATQSGEIKPATLNLPIPPTTQINPKINLPKEASPEAK
jgi:tetratricopeptide (TPR) repeat protein